MIRRFIRSIRLALLRSQIKRYEEACIWAEVTRDEAIQDIRDLNNLLIRARLQQMNLERT